MKEFGDKSPVPQILITHGLLRQTSLQKNLMNVHLMCGSTCRFHEGQVTIGVSSILKPAESEEEAGRLATDALKTDYPPCDGWHVVQISGGIVTKERLLELAAMCD